MDPDLIFSVVVGGGAEAAELVVEYEIIGSGVVCMGLPNNVDVERRCVVVLIVGLAVTLGKFVILVTGSSNLIVPDIFLGDSVVVDISTGERKDCTFGEWKFAFCINGLKVLEFGMFCLCGVTNTCGHIQA